MKHEKSPAELNPNAVDLKSLVNEALMRHNSTDTIPGADMDDSHAFNYYGGWMAAEEVLSEVVERDALDIAQVAVYLTQITSVPVDDLDTTFSGTPIDYEAFFRGLAMDIIYGEMKLVNPDLEDIDIERDEMDVERKRHLRDSSMAF